MKLTHRIGLLVSQALNAVAFGGDPDESVSARAYRLRNDGWAKTHARIDRLIGAGHCKAVWTAQIGREMSRNLPPQYR